MTRLLQQIEDRYEILEQLGEGGMGAIYKVRHRLLDDVRVVKVMRPQHESNPDLQARFLREAKAAVHLKHPNVAQVHDFWLDPGGTAFLVMEYIEGKNLQELLEAGAPTLELALEVARQSLRALGYLHTKQFVHRDVSPDNLMLTKNVDGQPLIKLIDLGIAKELENEEQVTKSGLFMGKVTYASPEQFGAAKEDVPIDGRSDLYSFGIVFYQLVTGHFPIEGEEAHSIIAGHLFRPPVSFDRSDPGGRVPVWLQEAILKALEKKPGRRFQSAAEFLETIDHPLRPALDHGLTAVIRPSEIPWQKTVRNDDQEETVVLDADVNRVEGILEEAARLQEDGDLEASLERLREVLEIAPANPEVRRLARELEETIERLRREERREAAVADVTESVRRLLQEGRLEEASEVLHQGEVEFGEVNSLLFLRVRLEKQQQRRQEIIDGTSEARELVESEQLAEAERILERVLELDAENEAAVELLEEIARARERKRITIEATALRRAATELLRDGESGSAVEKLEEALHLLPDDTEIEALLREASAALELEREREQRRQRISELLDRGHHTAADELLADAIVRHGPEGFGIEQARVEAARIEQLDARRQLAVDRMERGELAAAEVILEELVEKGDEDSGRLLAEVQAGQETLRAQQAVEEEFTRLRIRVERLLLDDEVEEASALLAEGLRQRPDATGLLALRKQLSARLEAQQVARERQEEARRRTRDANRQAVLAKAEAHQARSEAEQAEEEARGAKEEAEQAQTEAQRARARSQQTGTELEQTAQRARDAAERAARAAASADEAIGQARTAEEKATRAESDRALAHEAMQQARRQANLAHVRERAGGAVLSLLEEGRVEDAESALDEAEAALGETGGSGEAFATHRRRLETVRLNRSVTAELKRARTAIDRRDFEGAQEAIDGALRLDPDNNAASALLQEVEVREKAEQLELEKEAMTQTVESALTSVAGARVTVTPVEPVATTTGVGRKSRAKHLAAVWVGGAAALVVVVILALVSLGPEPAPLPNPGRLVLDAVPWGEIVAVRGDDGAITLPDDPFTPLVLELAPGRYEVTVRNPELGQEQTATAEVEAGRSEELLVVLTPVDVKEYFEQVRPKD